MKLMITGGTGFLGRRAAAWFREQAFQVLTPSHGELDLTDGEAVRNWFREHIPDVVIHTAAVSDVGMCQRNPELSEKVNVEGCVHLAKCCREWGSKLLICSSDQVYVGSTLSGPHREEEPVTPGNVYGNQKLHAEQKCLEILPDTVCLRLSWMYSTLRIPGEKGHFLSNLQEALKDAARPLSFPIHDRRGITDVDAVIQNLPKAWNLPGGVYNFGSENDIDTFHMVQQLLETLGLEDALARLVPNEEAFAENPRDLTMDTAKVKTFGIVFPTTKQGLLNALTERSGANMTLYICLDDRNGLQFNHRRQSRDSALLEDIRSQLTGPLGIDAFSEKLIREAEIPYVLAPESSEDFFAEDIPSEEILEQTKKLVIYRWNRHYPSDVNWEPDLTGMGFALMEATEFAGTSHEKITREVYER